MHSILENHLEDYLDGRMTRSVRESLEAHAAACPSCREMLEEAQAMSALLKQFSAASLDEPVLEPAAGFYLKVREGIEVQRASTPWWVLYPAFRQLATAALMLLLLLSGYTVALTATESGSTTAELLLDMPVEREAPALLSTHRHGNPNEICAHCWEFNRRSGPRDPGSRRDLALAAVVAGD